MASLELSDVTVSRDGRQLLDGVNLTVPDGERVALLGSSGAGKTTLLRTIAGAEQIEHGEILFDGQPVGRVPGRERGVAMVAQYGELLPHRDVAGNIAFPLELRHVPTSEVDRRVRAQARAFAIDDLLTRRSSTLSAGETAEVLLARTLVRKPTMVLMDEPFARIDGPTRALLVRDVIRVQEGYAATMLIATNDQRVAASIAPTIAVLRSGRVVQVGSPTELLLQPASLYVAGLSSDGPLNVLPARLTRERGRTSLQVGELRLPTWELAITERDPGPVQIAVHPGDLRLGTGAVDPHLRGRVVRHTFLGPVVDVAVATEDAQLVVRSPRPPPAVGTPVEVSIRQDRLHVFDAAGDAIAHRV